MPYACRTYRALIAEFLAWHRARAAQSAAYPLALASRTQQSDAMQQDLHYYGPGRVGSGRDGSGAGLHVGYGNQRVTVE